MSRILSKPGLMSIYDLDLTCPDEYGRKACGLSALAGLGLNVPAGFCIPGGIYDEYMIQLGIREKILNFSNSSRPEDLHDFLKNIRESIENVVLSSELESKIKMGISSLEFPVCARSSASAEDLDGHSFAGQYDTYLDINSPEECIKAVKKCWASAWTQRVYEYREKNGFDHLKSSMAVIVQEQVQAEHSGVGFSADPVSGQTDRVVIESCCGSGENLVSGRVTPQRCIFDKNSLRIIECSKGEDKDLSDKQMAEIAGSVKMIEEKFGFPVDVEWAYKDGKFYFVQSRRITAIKNCSTEKKQIWTNSNLGELFPDPVTPLNISLVKSLLKMIFGPFFSKLGFDYDSLSILGVKAGRLYFNITTFSGLFRSIPGLRSLKLSEVLGGFQDEAVRSLNIKAEDLPKIEFNLTKALIKFPFFVLWGMTRTPKMGEKVLLNLRKRRELLQSVDLSCAPDEEIKSWLLKVFDIGDNISDGLACASSGMMHFQNLRWISKNWLGDPEATIANELLAGVGTLDSAEPGLILWELACLAKSDELLSSLVVQSESFEELKAKINSMGSENKFLNLWDQFMNAHGHHARGELDIYKPRWRENPDYILKMIKSYINVSESCDIKKDYEDRAAKRKTLTQECIRKMKNPVKSAIFNYVLKNAHAGIALRETMKSEAVRYLSYYRDFVLYTGRRLQEKGIFSDKEDIFFLYIDELEAVLENNYNFNVKNLVASRRAEFEEFSRITPPSVIIGDFDPAEYFPEQSEISSDIFKGISVSSGLVIGPARVITHDNGEDCVNPGEILVIPFSDPGWTPYFIPAAGIVMDMGGMLSHGSIIAREYGIPTVVNVGPISKIVKTGDMIEVNANKGYARIINS